MFLINKYIGSRFQGFQGVGVGVQGSRRARIQGSKTFVSLSSRLESNKEEEEVQGSQARDEECLLSRAVHSLSHTQTHTLTHSLTLTLALSLSRRCWSGRARRERLYRLRAPPPLALQGYLAHKKHPSRNV